MTKEEISRKTLSYLGLARRCGKCAVGSDAVMSAVRKTGSEEKVAVILASDASERTKKQISDKCAHYGVTLVKDLLTGDEIASAVGKKMTVSTAALTEKNLASAIRALIGKEVP